MKKKELLARILVLEQQVKELQGTVGVPSQQKSTDEFVQAVRADFAKSIELQKKQAEYDRTVTQSLQEMNAEAEKENLLRIYSGDGGRTLLFSVPSHERTPGHVLAQRHFAVYGGCCNRFADQQGCDCLSEAYARQRGEGVCPICRNLKCDNPGGKH